MKNHRYLASILILVFFSAMVSGCASTPEKKLKAKGFTLSYKKKSLAGLALEKMHLAHPLKISEPEVRGHLGSFKYEELTLFGNKKPVFLPQDIDRISRLLTKAIQHAPKNKIVHYEVETPKGTTSGEVFASKKHIHWRFNTIKGMKFTGQARTGWGNVSWRMVPQSKQKYHSEKRLLGKVPHENWIVTNIAPIKINMRAQKNNTGDTNNNIKAPSRNPGSSPSTKTLDPVLKEKLQLLKDLHEKKLIDDMEYDQKRKELLDTYL